MNVEAALNKSFVTLKINAVHDADPSLSLELSLLNVRDILKQCINSVNCIKFYLVAETQMQKNVHDDVYTSFGFWTKTKIVLQESDLDKIITSCKEKILDSLEKFQQKGSGRYIGCVCVCVREREVNMR